MDQTYQMQKGKVLVNASGKLKVYEKNYPSHYLELPAIVFALKIWKNYLYGVHYEVFMDHFYFSIISARGISI